MGIRFARVRIPRTATIVNAYIQFTAAQLQSLPTALTIRGQAADKAGPFAAPKGNVSTRPTTTAAVAWPTVPAWTTIGGAGPDQRTPDLSAVIREIVHRPGWTSGNALAVIITGTGHRTATSFDGKRTAAPLLHVEYRP